MVQQFLALYVDPSLHAQGKKVLQDLLTLAQLHGEQYPGGSMNTTRNQGLSNEALLERNAREHRIKIQTFREFIVRLKAFGAAQRAGDWNAVESILQHERHLRKGDTT
jgi:hypothetical protein